MKKRLVMVLMAAGLVGCELRPPASMQTTSTPPPETPAAPTASKVPDMVYLSGGQGVFSLAALKGNVVLLDVCATWSPASRALVEELNHLWDIHRTQGLAVIGLALDAQPGSVVDPEWSTWNARYPLVACPRALLSRIADVRAIPTRLLVDRKGQVRRIYPGAVAGATLQADIENLLKE